MSKERYPVTPSSKDGASVDYNQYCEKYKKSIDDPVSHWREEAKKLYWHKFPTNIKNVSYDLKDFRIKWFEDGELNVSVNCLDRHLEKKANQTAFIWEGDDPKKHKTATYQEVYDEVCKLSNALRKMGVKKGDRVAIYMPMALETTYAMLACARIGAVHTVVFAGFSPTALAGRIQDADAKVVITADFGLRGGRSIPLKQNVDEALKDCPNIKHCIVLKITGSDVDWKKGRDIWYHEAIESMPSHCEPEVMNAEDPLFILYTSGSTGKPKGVLHTSGGYLLYAATTWKYIFDYRDGEIYWCSADVGWVTGHSYIVYGPLANGAISLVFEGVPNYPDASRFWQVIDKHKVNIFYTAPTAIRALMREGDEFVTGTSRKSIRVLGTVGEPINPEAWLWYYRVVGEEKSVVVDTWWQTETGAAMIAPLAGATDMKPGSASRPMFGIEPLVLDSDGKILEGEASGLLVIADSWPGQMRTVYGDHQRFKDTYFSTFKGYYYTGDGVRRDKDGYFWITGRVDDVLNVSGHRLGTAEVESALVENHKVAEAAVVGYPHEIKGEGIYCYVTLKVGITPSDDLKKELKDTVRKILGPIATPDAIQWAESLPKTRSGKIMRRILRKIASNDYDNLGDISTLADPTVVESLIKGRE